MSIEPDVQRIYEEFQAAEEYRRFTEITDRLNGSRWDVAKRDLGYSPDLAWFTEVGEEVVPVAVVDAAKATVGLCISVLGIARPEICWYRPETPSEAAYRRQRGASDLGQFQIGANTVGLARRDVRSLLLRADMSVRQTMTTAAHECRHLAQPPHADVDSYVANEQDARTFEAAFAAAYLSSN